MGKSENAKTLEVGFRQAFCDHYQSIYFYFAHQGMPEDECHDLTQETFLRVYKSMETLRHGERLQGWLFQIAANVWRNELRRRSADKRNVREVSLDQAIEQGETALGNDSWGGPSAHSPLNDAVASETVKRLRQAAKEFPPQMFRCFLLRFDQGLKYREIAAVMQVSIETVKSQLGEARRRLREQLDLSDTPQEVRP